MFHKNGMTQQIAFKAKFADSTYKSERCPYCLHKSHQCIFCKGQLSTLPKSIVRHELNPPATKKHTSNICELPFFRKQRDACKCNARSAKPMIIIVYQPHGQRQRHNGHRCNNESANGTNVE